LLLAAARRCPGAGQEQRQGRLRSACIACHGAGILGAPKFGDSAAWAARAKAGLDALVKSAIAGTAKGMPPKGGRADLSDAQMRSAIEYMMGGGGRGAGQGERHRPARPHRPPLRPGARAPSWPRAAPPPASATAVPAVARSAAPAPSGGAEVNAFNRLLKPLGRFNRPAVGIRHPRPGQRHDAAAAAAGGGLRVLPKSQAGNHVDWVKALDGKA
jgi:cytochrome c5